MQHPILAEIEAFLTAQGMAETTFGREVLKDWRFVKELRGTEERAPRRLWPETEQKIRHFIASYRPDAPASPRDEQGIAA